jgi:hypothetical protein
MVPSQPHNAFSSRSETRGILTGVLANGLLDFPSELTCSLPLGMAWAWMLKEGGYGGRGLGFEPASFVNGGLQ